MLEFVSSVINHRVNLGKLLKVFQVAKNHNEAFASSNVYNLIHHQQKTLALAPTRFSSLWNWWQSFHCSHWPWDQAPAGFWLCFMQVEGFAGTRDWCSQKCLAFTNLVRANHGFTSSLVTRVLRRVNYRSRGRCATWVIWVMTGQRTHDLQKDCRGFRGCCG